jgi:ABC-type nitrate/sulfonate/bicarbonate transport system permease component
MTTAPEQAIQAEAAVEPAVAKGTTQRKRRQRQRFVRGVAGIVAFFALWEIFYQVGWLNPLFFAEPVAIFRTMVEILSPGGELLPHVRESATEFVLGFGIAALGAIVLGVLIGWFVVLDDVSEPLMAAFYATPYVAFLPLVIIWVGIGLWSKVIIVMWAVFFPVLINAVAGVKNTPPEFLRVADSFCVGRWRLFTTVVLPAAVPYLLAGMRQAIGRGLVGVIVAEFYLAQRGIGFFIQEATSTYRPNEAFAAILLTSLTGIFLVRSVAVAERRVGRRWGLTQKT